jgi:hypothetical protein
MAKKLTRKETWRAGWLTVAILVALAWYSPDARLWGLPMFAWGAYELFFCPTSCGVQTKRDGSPCSHPVLGRLRACTNVGDHRRKKTALLLRMIGIYSRKNIHQDHRSEPEVSTVHRSAAHQTGPSSDIDGEEKLEMNQRVMLYLTIVSTVGTVVQAVTGFPL